ncbi:PREDICTED: uncharacterized protein LOC105532378 [Mandrillus leucophaeus]|uniref:uncharacterized protein LOC105532378 n=1 Tax=Mandrillus leucophaeus TaxID=9568 RepID=UPI0005F46334|nr:PREDICTED: uncharacterized protein LOC105532378 [Mandrillus leucophaeus]
MRGCLATGGLAGCNRPLSGRFCVPRLGPGSLVRKLRRGALRLGLAQQRPDSEPAGAGHQAAGAWRARSHGRSEAPQWPAPTAAQSAAPHSPLLSLGKSGLGKLTLINSLFLTDLYSPEYPGPSHRIRKTVQLEACYRLHC